MRRSRSFTSRFIRTIISYTRGGGVSGYALKGSFMLRIQGESRTIVLEGSHAMHEGSLTSFEGSYAYA